MWPRVLVLLSLILSTFAVSNYNETDLPADYQKLVEYAHLSSIAYCLRHGLKTGKLGDSKTMCLRTACRQDQFKDIEIVKLFHFNAMGEIGAGYYAIDHTKKRIILVFRGTASRRDWIADLNFFPVDYVPTVEISKLNERRPKCVGCRVHCGFYAYMKKNCMKLVNDVLKLKAKYPNYQLAVVGHSLGGALTILSGIEFQLMGFEPLVISFASPRIGNRVMADYVDKIFNTKQTAKYIDDHHDFQKGLIRVVHTRDIVPKLPPAPFFGQMGYQYYISSTELPHRPVDVERRGFQYEKEDENSTDDETTDDDDDDDDEDVEEMDIEVSQQAGFSLSYLGNKQHHEYFIRITGCSD